MTLDQESVDIGVHQGESSQLSRNRLIGRFHLDGLNESDKSDGEILVRFELTLDGTLKVTAIERLTGKSKALKIDNALSQMGELDSQASEERLESLFTDSTEFQRFETVDQQGNYDESEDDVAAVSFNSVTPGIHRIDAASQTQSKLKQLIAKAKTIRKTAATEDASDIDRLVDLLEDAELNGGYEMIPGLEAELDDLLFYLAD
jgi:molecular chaperone DnaK